MKENVLLRIRVQPNSQKNQVVGILSDGRIKIKLQAPPLDGKANKALIRYLHQIFNIPETRFDLVQGEHNRDKVISLQGLSESEVNQILQAQIPD